MPAASLPVGGSSETPSSSPSSTTQPFATNVSNNDAGNKREDTNTEGDKGTGPAANSGGGASHDASQEVDDFGLPIRKRTSTVKATNGSSEENNVPEDTKEATSTPAYDKQPAQSTLAKKPNESGTTKEASEDHSTKIENKVQTGGHEPEPAPSTAKPDVDSSDPPPPYRPSTSKSRTAEISEWSHMRLAHPHEPNEESEEDEEEHEEWKAMPALGEFDYYDDYGRLIARGVEEEDSDAVYQGLGGAGKGYTRVQLDEDAQSATSMDEDTSYLFREGESTQAGVEGEELRDSMGQLQATKDLLNETQKIAYVGVVRLAIHEMNLEVSKIPTTRGTKKIIQKARDAMRKWGQAMMGRLYMHMDINSAEQIMIEQLAEHGVQPGDLVRPLMQNARVNNPMAKHDQETSTSSVASPTTPASKNDPSSRFSTETEGSEPDSPPPYEMHEGEELPEVRTPSQMPTSERIDIDLRWTVLCDLFLVLIADSAYDARSRTLLERVGAAMDVTWLQISRFEKRVTDALEMQEQADKETWDESEHMEKRRQRALKLRYMVMGLATVGGGLVIGLSAGLLAPVIGAGLAAGFTTVGISGTSAFLGGASGTALIASGATVSGGVIGMKASHRRTGAVQTFEYRPLHNNKKVNLIVTVSGWMIGKVDDVRLPYSTVDPIMGDIYSVLWEPEMLQSMGDTINILATEVSFRSTSCPSILDD